MASTGTDPTGTDLHRHVPRRLVHTAKRIGRTVTQWLPGDAGPRTRHLVRESLVRVGLAAPTGPTLSPGWTPTAPKPDGSGGAGLPKPPKNPKLSRFPELWNSFQATPELAVIDDPESGHAMCPMCGTTVDAFLPFGVKTVRPERQCPGCGSLERHRLVWLYFALRTDLLAGGKKFLHIAPEPTMQVRIMRIPGLDYLTGDIVPGKAMVEMDITDIDFPDHSFDVIYASHVLEHVPEDVRAMSELRRILTPEGWAILEVPIYGEKTREDPTITDPAERTRLFGQHDHVRMYGHDGVYEQRLRQAGFQVDVVDLAGELGPAAAHRYRLDDRERVYVCRP